jgi:hypothetical protein
VLQNGGLDMALERPTPPESFRAEASDGLRRSTGRTLGLEVAGGTPATLTDPHQVFTIDRSDLIGGAGLDKAQAVGWRYLGGAQGPLGGSAPAPTVVAEVAVRDGLPSFTNRQEGWLAKRTRETMDIAAKLPEIGSGSYELRMLRLPSVQNTDAIWLKNKGDGSDVVIPIASRSPELVSGKAYSANDFLKITREVAKQSSFDNSPRSERTSGA